MDKKETVKGLASLIQLDIDAMHAYLQAIKNIDYTPIREQLGTFLEDHERHAVELSKGVRSLGAEPPEFSRDFKGFVIAGFTSLMSAAGTGRALEAMRSNEKLTNRKYREALDLGLPGDIRPLVGSNYADEQRHLAYIEQMLAERPWEKR